MLFRSEAILITWIVIAFFAAAYQLFLANHTIYQTLTAVHQEIFRQGFEHNCFQHESRCTYRTDPSTHADVVWNARVIPEIQMPVVGLFARFQRSFGIMNPVYESGGVLKGLAISNERSGAPGCPECKRTIMGAGPGGPGSGLTGTGRLFEKSVEAARRPIDNPSAYLKALTDRWGG